MKKYFAVSLLLVAALVSIAQINPGGGGGTGGGGAGDITSGANLGTGVGVFSGKSGTALQFNSLVAGTGITVVSNSNNVTITATGGGGGGSDFDTTQFATNASSAISLATYPYITNIVFWGELQSASATNTYMSMLGDSVTTVIGAVPTIYVDANGLAVGNNSVNNDVNLVIGANTTYNKLVRFQTGGFNEYRWNMGMDNLTESGSDAGSLFYLEKFSDAVASNGRVFEVGRASTSPFRLMADLEMGAAKKLYWTNDTDTYMLMDGGNSIELHAGGSQVFEINPTSVSQSAGDLTISTGKVAANGFQQTGVTGQRLTYWDASGITAAAALISTPGNTGDVDVARMSLISSSSAAAMTFRSVSGTNGLGISNHSTNLVFGITNLATVASGVGMTLAQGDLFWYDGVNFTNLPAGTDNYVLTMSGSSVGWEASAGGGGGYSTIQEEGSPLTQRDTMNFIGGGVTAADNTSVTDITFTRTGVNRTIWFDAGSMISRTTSGAATGLEELTTNKQMSDYLAFDASTDEFSQVRAVIDNWNGSTIKARIYWSSAAASGDVVWGVQGVAVADDGATDTAFGTVQTVTDSVTAAGDLMISSATAAITLAGSPAAGQVIWLQIYRDADAGGDTMAGDAKLLGVLIQYTESSTEAAAW